jgi:hypothetical protein
VEYQTSSPQPIAYAGFTGLPKGPSNVARLDGYQAMHHASGLYPLDPKQASFDLLVDIRNKIQASPLTWSFYWVEGHQIEHQDSEDFWGILNNVCDSVAKTFWN